MIDVVLVCDNCGTDIARGESSVAVQIAGRALGCHVDTLGHRYWLCPVCQTEKRARETVAPRFKGKP